MKFIAKNWNRDWNVHEIKTKHCDTSYWDKINSTNQLWDHKWTLCNLVVKKSDRTAVRSWFDCQIASYGNLIDKTLQFTSDSLEKITAIVPQLDKLKNLFLFTWGLQTLIAFEIVPMSMISLLSASHVKFSKPLIVISLRSKKN